MLLGAGLAAGCVDRDGPSATPLVVCEERDTAPAPPRVEVSADLGALGIIHCSGALVSPKLVLTSAGCLALPTELEGLVPEPSNEPYLGQRSSFPRELSYERMCRPGPAWLPIEDGTSWAASRSRSTTSGSR
jgi:hypothetical protein